MLQRYFQVLFTGKLTSMSSRLHSIMLSLLKSKTLTNHQKAMEMKTNETKLLKYNTIFFINMHLKISPMTESFLRSFMNSTPGNYIRLLTIQELSVLMLRVCKGHH